MSDPSFQLDDELLSAYIDGQLAEDELRAVEQWLERDPAARATVEELRSVSASVQSLPREALPDTWRIELAERLDNAATSGGGADGGMPTLSIGRSARGWWYSGAAIAAAVAIVCYTQLNQVQQPGDVALKAPAAAGEIAERGAERLDADDDAFGRLVIEAEESDATHDLDVDDFAMDELAMAEGAGNASQPSAPATNNLNGLPPALATEAMPESIAEPTEEIAVATNLANTYLIVWADMPPEALREQQINRVLEDNGIAVEDRTDDWLAAAAPVRQQIELRNQLGVNLGDEATRGGGTGGRASSGRFSVPDRGRDAYASEDRSAGEFTGDIEGDTILVEATADQIAACLAEMQQDTSNYKAVTVEPVQPSVVAVQFSGLLGNQQAAQAANQSQAEEQLAEFGQQAGGLVADGQYAAQQKQQSASSGNEAMQQAEAQSLPRARRLERPNQWYYDNTAPQDAANAYQLRGAKKELAKANLATKSADAIAGKVAQLNNINRLLTEQNFRAPQPQPLLTENQPVQVLFVLRNSYLADASGTAPATEAAPAEAP